MSDDPCRSSIVENAGNALTMSLWGLLLGSVGYIVVAAWKEPKKLTSRPEKSRGQLLKTIRGK
jgi:hypothetical protein